MTRNSTYRNNEGYFDSTAGGAMNKVMSDEKFERDKKKFERVLGIIFDVCRLAGFHIEGRITLVDENSGRVWR